MVQNEAYSDEELLELFIGGDQSAFTKLYERHSKAMLGFISTRYFAGDEDSAEDVVQQAFLKLCEQHERYDRKLKLRPWLFSLAANLAIDLKRAQAVRFAHSFAEFKGISRQDYDPADPRAPDVPDQVVGHEHTDLLHVAISTLPDGDREAVEAVYLGGLEYAQAAELLGIPVGSLKTRVHRSLKALRCRLDTGGRMTEAA